jgi:hypothetical protein
MLSRVRERIGWVAAACRSDSGPLSLLAVGDETLERELERLASAFS